ncbi:unnamed protein product [Ophioblennius macclurei]
MTMVETKSCSLPGVLILLLLLSGAATASGLGSVVSRTYSYYFSHYTWREAQSYCRRHHQDLAFLYEESDKDNMSMDPYYAWIGQFGSSGGGNNSLWADGDDDAVDSSPRNESHVDENCTSVFHIAPWIHRHRCATHFFFFCQYEEPQRPIFVFIAQSKTWWDARDYCRQRYDHLATFADDFSLERIIYENFPVWIGLHREETWKWSSGFNDNRIWDQDDSDDGGCISISSKEKKMATKSCAEHFPFLCFDDNILVVKENKSWTEALEHCRALGSTSDGGHAYDLVSVQPGVDQQYMMTRVAEADTEEVWVSLRFLAGYWLWATGADMSHPDMPSCPLEWALCGALSKGNASSVETRDCMERKNFLCYRK